VSLKARKKERLEQITRTAVSIFYKRGYLQTSTREIAEACGISKGNLYHYIRSKEDLLALSIEISSAQIEKFARAMARELRTSAPSVVLVRAVRRTLLMIDDLQEMILFWYRESGNVGPSSLDMLIKQDMYTKDLYRQIFEEGCRKGEFRISDPVLAAFDVMVLCDMWALKRWYMRKHYTLDQYIGKCQEIALAIALGKERPSVLGNEPGPAATKAKPLKNKVSP
jgi:AcrR family transcriptional regulator